MFVRFVVAERHEESDQPRGIFSALYTLEEAGELADYELVWFRQIERWFNRNLARPKRLAWSSRPNAPERAISWLKMSAKAHVRQMRQLMVLLEHKGIPVQELRTEKPGYILYEDRHQVAAIPFPNETI